jgi:hypothetical protein
MHVQPIKADGEFLRKGLGLAGAALIVNGLSKVFRGSPRVGMLRAIGGATISLGGICSDLMYTRLLLLSQKLRIEQQREQLQQQSFWRNPMPWVKNYIVRLGNGLQEVGNGHGVALGNAALSEFKMRNGLEQIQKGQVLSGLDSVYDGLYRKIRENCARLLYQIDV